ncbi:protein FAF-like, chloroplastic [Senna tora]|uniref:Protein FAF-like, chloroplastic n=1 Tax=Senna tora TaxID=362788 RepID=A0A834SR10_9FABA|nr:protein FAF-like, chloroplastic [Senna tora]
MLVAFSQMSASSMMSKTMNIQAQSLLSSSLGIEEETKNMQKQGIVTILSSDCERGRASSSSLRRTLSADMSSKKWLSQNGFSPVNKIIASSEELSHSETIIASAESDSSSSSERESDDYEERKDLDAESIWRSIQKDKENKESERAGVFDIWSSIVSHKTNEDTSKSSLPPPYVHPLVKRSQSSLSEKSLEICTESLGSETGSDGFSSYPPSEAGDAEDYKEEEAAEKETEQACYETEEDFAVPKYNYLGTTTKKAAPRSFPPPLPSLSRQDGPSIHMRSHRDNGRLVLEAVSVPSQNNFCARRQDGRLLLTFNNHLNKQDAHDDEEQEGEYYDEEELEEEFGEVEEDHEEEEEDEDDEETEEEIGESEIKREPTMSSVDRIPLTMNKPIGFVNRNPKWSEKLNEVVNFEEKSSSVAKSLPPRPRVTRLVASASAAAASPASFNAYESYWKAKFTNHQQPINSSSSLKKNDNNTSSKFGVSGEFNQTPNEQQKLLVLRGKNGDYLVHKLKSCKEPRRPYSFLFGEPQCIATS